VLLVTTDGITGFSVAFASITTNLGASNDHLGLESWILKYCYTEIMRRKVTINARGVITIPAAFRQAFGLEPHDELILEDTEHGILLRPAVSVPIEIYTEDRVAEFSSDEEAIGERLGKAE